ncbi:DUF6360 family protein [Halomicrococcus gelatinilyticus]|uniref:DUF6360 family protein n=1 Tax=Halomicrococcus gelatinilyticus TaxID=1702103 RepID=UPI002E1681C2
MADRVMSVADYTTFDLFRDVAEGHGWSEETDAILDVSTPRVESPDVVTLQLELDNAKLGDLPAHGDTVSLSTDRARELANELECYADRVES